MLVAVSAGRREKMDRIQMDLIKGLDWLQEALNRKTECPICRKALSYEEMKYQVCPYCCWNGNDEYGNHA